MSTTTAAQVVHRDDSPYVALRRSITMGTFGEIADRLPEVEPVAAGVEAEGDVLVGSLPAGRYATVSHTGHPDELVEVTGRLLEWAAQQGLVWDAVDTPDGEAWGCRLEVLHTDPPRSPT